MPDHHSDTVRDVLAAVASGALSAERGADLLGRLKADPPAAQPVQREPQPMTDSRDRHIEQFANQIAGARDRSGWTSTPLFREGER